MTEVHEMLEGIDPASLPQTTPADEALIALITYREAEDRWRHAIRMVADAAEDMDAASTPIAYAEARLKRDTWIDRKERFAREKTSAEADYGRLRPHIKQPLTWEGDDA